MLYSISTQYQLLDIPARERDIWKMGSTAWNTMDNGHFLVTTNISLEKKSFFFCHWISKKKNYKNRTKEEEIEPFAVCLLHVVFLFLGAFGDRQRM